MAEKTLMVKEVDWSTLHYGFNIPVEFQPILYDYLELSLQRGESTEITITINDKKCKARLSNSNFDTVKFANHPTDIVRVLYSPTSKLSDELRKMFGCTYKKLEDIKKKIGPRKVARLENGSAEAFVLSFNPTTFEFELSYQEPANILADIKRYVSEEIFEGNDLIQLDPNASLEERNRIVRLRKIDKSIGDNLKRIYNYRCQITGERIGGDFGCKPIVEAHHIEYFSTSLNNDSNNIIIVSPDFHRIIHAYHPVFDRNKLAFNFPNGLSQRIILNKHL